MQLHYPKMKLLLFLLLPLFGMGQPKDTTHGFILVQTCEQCIPVYRPVITVNGSHQVRYWRRAWLLGRVKYYYKPVPGGWRVIDYKSAQYTGVPVEN